jgi:ATP-dependent Clp protease ATP-binding subunit ClpC
MFERFTEKARRAVFFARYEASQHGTPYIETPSLLLGIVREDKDLMARLLPAGAEELIRLIADVEALFPKFSGKIATSVDLPLSRVAKLALNYAAEEAERRHHRAIEPLHLLWGLLTAGGPETACLNAHGITLEAVNRDLAWKAGAIDRRALLHQALDAIPEDRLDAAATLLNGLVSGKFEVTGTSLKGPFHFSFDDKPE